MDGGAKRTYTTLSFGSHRGWVVALVGPYVLTGWFPGHCVVRTCQVEPGWKMRWKLACGYGAGIEVSLRCRHPRRLHGRDDLYMAFWSEPWQTEDDPHVRVVRKKSNLQFVCS